MENPDPPLVLDSAPNRRLHLFLRVMLWILPTGFLGMSFVGVSWLTAKFHHATSVAMILWILSNVIFVIGAGWCDYKLARGWVKDRYFEITSVVMFAFLQIMIIPSVVAFVALMIFWFVALMNR